MDPSTQNLLYRRPELYELIYPEKDEATPRMKGQRGTGQKRRRVKEDENGIGIAGARGFSSNTDGGGWGRKQIGRGVSHAPFRRNKTRDAGQKTTRQALSTEQADR
jgi:hypothetical protein